MRQPGGTCGKCPPAEHGAGDSSVSPGHSSVSPGEPGAHLPSGSPPIRPHLPSRGALTRLIFPPVFSWVVVVEECGEISGTLAWLF